MPGGGCSEPGAAAMVAETPDDRRDDRRSLVGASRGAGARRAASAGAPARLGAGTGTGALLAGAALRLAVVLAGFAAVAWVAVQPGLALIAALSGFTLARALGLWRIRNKAR